MASLGRAPKGGRELDIVVSFVLGDTSSEAGKMIQLLVEEGYPWDVISELLDEELPAYTSSLDAALPGENVVLAAYAKKRKQWVAVHRRPDGGQISAWAASECLARRAPVPAPAPTRESARRPARRRARHSLAAQAEICSPSGRRCTATHCLRFLA